MKTKIEEAFEEANRAAEAEARPPQEGRPLIRTIHPEVRVVDGEKGLVDYIASDQSIDSHREIVLARGWKFDRFEKNAPFVDSHNYSCIDRLLGKVVDWRISDGKLVERVQWAIDDPNHTLAQIGWKLTVSGFLKAVSVGFIPIKWVDKWGDSDGFLAQLDKLGLDTDSGVRAIFQEQQQLELSAVLIGSNANAVARAYKADALDDEDLETLSAKCEQLENRNRATPPPGTGARSPGQAESERAFLRNLHQIINK